MATWVVTSGHRLRVGDKVPKSQAIDLAQAFYRDEIDYATRALAEVEAGTATVEEAPDGRA